MTVPLVLSLPPVVIPRFAALGFEPEVILVALAKETWFAPVSRIAQLPGPAFPRPKSSANAEQLQNKTSSRTVIQTSLARHAFQEEAGRLYEHLLPAQWSTCTGTQGNRSRGIVEDGRDWQ